MGFFLVLTGLPFIKPRVMPVLGAGLAERLVLGCSGISGVIRSMGGLAKPVFSRLRPLVTLNKR